MELLQLKYFYESAIHGSFAKTADIYMVPASSVSASVKRLERELGCLLFDRRANRIFLNKNGIRLKNALSSAFDEIDSAIADISSHGDDRDIKMLVRAVRSDITGFIIEYNEKHPRTAFKTVFDFSDTDYEKYDVIIDTGNMIGSNFDSFRLCDMKLRLKAAKSYAVMTAATSLSELSLAPFISWGEQSNMHKILIEVCNRAGFFPNIVASSNDRDCYERLLRAGVGIGLGREDTERDRADLLYLNLCDFDETYSVFCYYKKESCYNAVKSFVDFLKTKVR